MSKILETAHEMARDLHSAGAMSDVTMRQIDKLCLPPKRRISAYDVRGVSTINRKTKTAIPPK